MNVRVSGLTWALVCCPVFGWMAAVYGERSVDRGLTVFGGFALMAILPAALASVGNALLGRDLGAVARSGALAASVCFGGFLLLVAAVLVTFNPQ